jgi:hypothetical protein
MTQDRNFPLLSGPDLDKARDEITTWYVESRLRGIQALSEPYPYGSMQITPEEQYSNYLRLTPQDWQTMRQALHRMYLGHPKASTLIDEELHRYQERMRALGLQIQSRKPIQKEPG